MKVIILCFSILWAISVLIILYCKVNIWGLDANNLSLVLSAIYAILTSTMYFLDKKVLSKKQVTQSATADNSSTVIQVGRDYKEK
ncbi:hypothetical protein [Acinetobacter baumannii]|uniref:hypothetical protein n=1 Tax=Acinetobacter baumannii TaxID=470 RepID=UPI001C4A9EF0|nr:hypothetical protein [Acinetobacter baumannii]